jgi:hypothetical protein
MTAITKDINLGRCETQWEQREAFERQCRLLPDGTIGVAWLEGFLWLRDNRGNEQSFRGAAVRGCDASDSFVQHLANEFFTALA